MLKIVLYRIVLAEFENDRKEILVGSFCDRKLSQNILFQNPVRSSKTIVHQDV